MYLRKLKLEDAPLMLEWMHDDSVVHDLHTNFASKTIEDCEKFIKANQTFTDNVNLAIASDADEYMGTVSLKQIDREHLSAEFAITVRKASMGHGYSWFGMTAIIDKAFNEYGLESVYWCVSRKNKRAVRFYDKHNFHETVDISESILSRYQGEDDLKWYSVLKGDVLDDRKNVAGCKVVRIKTIPTVNAGGDDTYPIPDTFSKQVHMLEEKKAEVIVGKVQQCNQVMEPIAAERFDRSNEDLPKVLNMGFVEARKYITKRDIFPIANQACCYRSSFFEDGGLCDEQYYLIEDVSLANRVLALENKAVYIDCVTVNHRAKGGISTSRELFSPRRLLYYKDCVTYAENFTAKHPEIYSYIYRKQSVKLSRYIYKMAEAKSKGASRIKLVIITAANVDTVLYYAFNNKKKLYRRLKERIQG